MAGDFQYVVVASHDPDVAVCVAVGGIARQISASHFFGEIAFLDQGARTADAIAATKVELYCISRRRVDELARSKPELAAELFARLARGLAIRLRYTDGELRALKEA